MDWKGTTFVEVAEEVRFQSRPLQDMRSASTGKTLRRNLVATLLPKKKLGAVRSNKWINPEYKHLVLDAPPTALRVQPGQFFHLACPPSGQDAAYLRRPMSLYRVAPHDERIEFLYKVQGVGTRGLALLAPGDIFDALGPVGRGFTLRDVSKAASFELGAFEAAPYGPPGASRCRRQRGLAPPPLP